MTALLFSLALGVFLIVLAHFGLVRFARMEQKKATAVVVLVTVGFYVPYSIIFWPGGDLFAIHLAIYLLAGFGCGMALNPGSRAKNLHWAPIVISSFFIALTALLAGFVVVAERGLPSFLGDWFFSENARARQVSSVFPGVISHDFHKKEALYNEYLQQVQRQRQRGWQVQKGWLREAVANQPAVFRVAVRTNNGDAVSGATVAGKFLRPSSSQQDVSFDLNEREPGVYEAELKLPLAGQWNLVLRIQKGEDLHEIRALTKVLDRQVAAP
ncbi:MAG: FixH family protein [Streptococcus sp.]|jgi:nitrogen fixation protein FixH|nr:FixH family protein [Streptococcus sp.]